ncbi:MAG: FAD-dependent monooxygenase [Alphaproteobacteria bacterium]|nr:FAD-dependent monooxygenase [Alphaproteobacteria bacterium]
MSLALRLCQRGLKPVIIEHSPTLRDGGYMLGLSDPGYDAAERMGVAEALGAAQYMPRRIAHIGADGRTKFALQGRSLDILAGERQLNLMRGDIERILYERLRDDAEFHFGASVATLDQAADGVRVRLDDATVIEADLAVGADGLHSNLRALAFGPEERFIRFLGARVAAFILDRSAVPAIGEDETASLTEVGRAIGLAAIRGGRLVAFFIYRTGRERRFETVEAELKHAFAGAGWHVPTLLDHVRVADSVYFDEVAQAVVPRWSYGRAVLLGDAAAAVSLIAGKGATLAMAGGLVLADALADQPADMPAALARFEAKLRPMTEPAQAMARRNVGLFAPSNRLQLVARDFGLRLAGLPLLARLAKRFLNREGERL